MKNKQHTLPSFFLISSAVDGNENAIEKLLLFYEAYISKCCLRPFYDEYGNVYIVVDMELKGRIREKKALILIVLLPSRNIFPIFIKWKQTKSNLSMFKTGS